MSEMFDRGLKIRRDVLGDAYVDLRETPHTRDRRRHDLLIGGPMGLLSGHAGGLVDTMIQRVMTAGGGSFGIRSLDLDRFRAPELTPL